MSFVEILDKNIVDLNMQTLTKEDAIKHLSGLLKNAGYISNEEDFISDIYLRESEGITGIGEGIAIPHGKSDSVTRIGIAVGRCEKEIEWASLDGKPVKVIFLFAVSKDQYNAEHLKLLGELAGSLGRGNTSANLCKMRTYEELVEAFTDRGKGTVEDFEELMDDIEIKME